MFRQAQNELALLLVALDTVKENLESTTIQKSHHSELRKELLSCHQELLQLQELKDHFESVGPRTQVTWEREGWKLDQLTGIRARLMSFITIINMLNINMIKSSQAHVVQQLEAFISELRNGTRADSVLSGDSLSIDGREAWKQLRRELRNVGISHEAFFQHRELIKTTLLKAIKNEQVGGEVDFYLEDMEENLGPKRSKDRF